MNMRFIGPLVVFIAIAALLGIGLTMNPRDIPSTMLDKPAPNFSLPVLANPQQTFSPSDLKGQRWVLNVWASWCVSCRYEHPLLNQLASNGATIVGLNYKDEPDKAAQWLAERGNPYTVSPLDQQGRAGIEWGVIAVPETFIIDEAGNVIYKHTGPITPELVANEFVPLLGLSERQP
ncbi:DsbE family thiol:disulfide interchange protein [Arenicella xantha]|uniref:Cytochrome c biogenesis protein CcmG/thiol:disulfide interchange protein DsbE n=1 Tax=Arenicella xantha TaxID=644221 RepID=A0A395JFU4_9GAMM|nr:DsbE family thiol:disulfide interchange protein [Arenicella xantha]RBP48609.1 cytochrome c biogenesis protein CcmG/thiol:disulfide interchange protein DsbE [Arenicella xantha]